MKKILGLLIALVLVFSFAGCGTKAPSTSLRGDLNGDGVIRVGILEFIQQASLDLTQQGITDYLASQGYDANSIVLDIQNGTGDPGITNTMAQKLVNDGCDIIIAIATPAAQAVYSATAGTKIPVIYTAVSDPVSAGLTDNSRTTGVSDMLDTKTSVDLVKQLLPNAKTIGVVHNSAEVNSMTEVANLKVAAEAQGLNVVDNTIETPDEIPLAVDNVLAKSDVIVCMLDNMVASAMDVVCGKADAAGKVVIGSEASQVNQGAVASVGADYYKVGQQTGGMALSVLQGINISTIGPAKASGVTVTVNKTIADKYGIPIPTDAVVVQ